jgi:4-coumarate--CoA ligase
MFKLLSFVCSRLCEVSMLTDIVLQFIEEVPKSPSGKIQRKVIREWAAVDAKAFNKPKAKL